MPEIIECKGSLNPRNIFRTMCRGAPELKGHEPKEGDRYLHPTGKVFILSSYCIRIERSGEFYLAMPLKTLNPHFDTQKFDPNSPVFDRITEVRFDPLRVREFTWLPRVEQFQDMLQPLSIMTILHLFYGFVQQGKGRWHSFKNAPLPDPTMEQLWMCFTWRRLYDKMWEGIRGWRKCSMN